MMKNRTEQHSQTEKSWIIRKKKKKTFVCLRVRETASNSAWAACVSASISKLRLKEKKKIAKKKNFLLVSLHTKYIPFCVKTGYKVGHTFLYARCSYTLPPQKSHIRMLYLHSKIHYIAQKESVVTIKIATISHHVDSFSLKWKIFSFNWFLCGFVFIITFFISWND